MIALRLPAPMTLVWLLRRCTWYIGWLPMGLSVLLLALWVALSQQQSTQVAQLDALKKEIRQLAASSLRPAQAMPMAAAAALAPQPPLPAQPVQLATLWQQLPVFADLSPRMITIARMAQKRQIALNVGDYQWQAHQASNTTQAIQQFDMRFTIQADYATCRQFMLDVLKQYPSMALTGLELRKNETVQPVVDATLTFSVFIRGGRADGV